MTDLDDLVRRWATGWAASRQMPLTATPDGWLARVGDAHRDTEHVSVRPSEATVVRLVDGVVHARVEVDGVPAARGQATVVHGTLVVDKVSTEPAFRRRGLGRAVMAALTEDAVARGASDALLVASPEGRALYATLGWSDVAPVRTWAGAAPATPA